MNMTLEDLKEQFDALVEALEDECRESRRMRRRIQTLEMRSGASNSLTREEMDFLVSGKLSLEDLEDSGKNNSQTSLGSDPIESKPTNKKVVSEKLRNLSPGDKFCFYSWVEDPCEPYTFEQYTRLTRTCVYKDKYGNQISTENKNLLVDVIENPEDSTQNLKVRVSRRVGPDNGEYITTASIIDTEKNQEAENPNKEPCSVCNDKGVTHMSNKKGKIGSVTCLSCKPWRTKPKQKETVADRIRRTKEPVFVYEWRVAGAGSSKGHVYLDSDNLRFWQITYLVQEESFEAQDFELQDDGETSIWHICRQEDFDDLDMEYKHRSFRFRWEKED
jgi:hypothetical protein